jgi:hypothetical protein
MHSIILSSLFLALVATAPRAVFAADSTASPADAFAKKFPASENVIRLFNGKDLDGWDGAKQIWSVEGDAIHGANSLPIPTSTYLFTKESYRNFRLIFEVKQTMSPAHSTMHSAVAALGERFTDKGDNAHGFRGPLLMFCQDWGIWDAYRRNRVVPVGPGPKVEKRGDWNLIEILVIGNRIRFAANGTLIFDFTDKPEMLRECPIGLQIHSNSKPQEYRFRGLVLSKNPEDKLVTVADK